jgi:hypothetical protein
LCGEIKIGPAMQYELGDWVRFKGCSNIYLVIAVLLGNEVKLSGMPISVGIDLLELVQKNNKPK